MINYFISDLHLGHKNVLEFTSRKSKNWTLDYMAEFILAKIHHTVTEKDRLVLVGDVCWNSKAFIYLEQFPANTILVSGNHDVSRKHYEAYRDAGWKIVGAMQHENAIVTHIPVHPCQLEERFKFNIHGHTHDDHVTETFLGNPIRVYKDNRYLNASCEAIDYTPKTYEQLKTHYGVV